MDIFYLLIGAAVGSTIMYWIISSNYKLVKETSEEDDSEEEENEDEVLVDEDFDDESGDDSNYYYVKFPHQPRPVEICLEDQLLVGHNLLYKEKIYKIIVVLHKVDGHTVFVAEPKSESNVN